MLWFRLAQLLDLWCYVRTKESNFKRDKRKSSMFYQYEACREEQAQMQTLPKQKLRPSWKGDGKSMRPVLFKSIYLDAVWEPTLSHLCTRSKTLKSPTTPCHQWRAGWGRLWRDLKENPINLLWEKCSQADSLRQNPGLISESEGQILFPRMWRLWAPFWTKWMQLGVQKQEIMILVLPRLLSYMILLLLRYSFHQLCKLICDMLHVVIIYHLL